DPRRQRGHLFDHAQLHRHRADRVPDASHDPRSPLRRERHHDRADPEVRPGAWGQPHLVGRHQGVRADLPRDWDGRAVPHRRQPHAVRVRPARNGPVELGGTDERCERQKDDRDHAAAVGCDGRPGRHAGPAGRLALLLLDHVPDRAWLHRYRDRAARPEQSGRHRVRRAAVGVPRPVRTDPRHQQHPQGDRADHPGCGGALRRHRLRAGTACRARAPATPCRTGTGRAGARDGRSPGVTVQDTSAPTATVRLDPVKPARRLRGGQLWLAALAGLVLIALVRVITNANDITSTGTLGATIALGMPIALAGLGGLWSERSGVVNIGLEGMMILGTFFGADFAYFTHSPWMGVVGGIVGGFIGGIVHAVATVTFGVDQIVSGVAITILATGLARYLAGVFFTGQSGGGPTQSPAIPQFTRLRVPALDSFFGRIENHHWFL